MFSRKGLSDRVLDRDFKSTLDEIRDTERMFNASSPSRLKVDVGRPFQSLAKRIGSVNQFDDLSYEVTSENGSSRAVRTTSKVQPQWKLLGEKGLPARPSGSDRRLFHPMGAAAPYATTTGNAARVEPTARGNFRFRSPTLTIPCIQRLTRRQVLFAKRKHGAHYTRRRRRPVSSLEC